MTYVVASLVFVAISLFVYVILNTLFSEERKVARRLRDMSEWESAQAKEMEPNLRPFRERILQPAGESVSSVGRAMAPRGYVDSVRTKLRLAGQPRGMDAGRFTTAKLLATLGVLGAFIGLSVIRPVSGLTWLMFALPLTALAFFGPDLWLTSRVKERKSAIRRALPDMLDMLTISVEAGLGFDAALAKLVRNSGGPLAEEFGRVLQEVQAGVDRSDAMRNLAERTQVSELNSFIMAVIQAEVFGISISGVLRTQASEMRLKRRQHAEEIAQKAPVKLVFPLILCILPATLIVILGPAIVSIMRVFG